MRKILNFAALTALVWTVFLLCPKAAYALDLAIPGAIPEQDIMSMPTVPVQTAEPVAQTPMTYIDVSIDNQMLVYYVNGAPALITPCVTGKPGRGTPRGVFAINSCVPGKYLNGPTWHVWVNRWMRFCGNVGIHDATWRKSFGGEIYKSNGSHGCVNIPHDQAVLLYSMVGVGTPVIVH